MLLCEALCFCSGHVPTNTKYRPIAQPLYKKVEAFPLQAWTGPEFNICGSEHHAL